MGRATKTPRPGSSDVPTSLPPRAAPASPSADTLDSDIDRLYALPLADFTAARNALAKRLKGEDAARVKKLEKPALVPWAVNQLVWRDRRTYDDVMRAGRALRDAQIGALEGRQQDTGTALAVHRAALAAAVRSAADIARSLSANPPHDTLARMLETLSLAPDAPQFPGRHVDVVQPAGLEALSGLTPLVRPAQPIPGTTSVPVTSRGKGATGGFPSSPTADAESRLQQQLEHEAAARTAAEATVAAALSRLEHASTRSARAEAEVQSARHNLERAEAELRTSRHELERARAEHSEAVSALAALTRRSTRR